MPTTRAVASLLAGWVLVSCTLKVPVFGSAWGFLDLLPSGVAGLLLAPLLLSAWARRAAGFRWLVAGLWSGLIVFRLIDEAFSNFYHRPFRVVLDLPLLPEAPRLLIATDGALAGGVQLGLALACLFVTWLVMCVVLAALQRAARAVSPLAPRGRAMAAAALALPLGGLGLGASGETLGARLVDEVVFCAEFPGRRAVQNAALVAHAQRVAKLPADFGALAGADLTVIFIESYGRGAIEGADGTLRQERALARFERRVSAVGFEVASAYVTAPTFGGGSWFAHATFATGVRVWAPLEYSLLLKSVVSPLGALLRRAGYETYSIAPGTTRPWPEGAFFQFEHSLSAVDFAYEGPVVGWGRFPDQYVLDQVRRRVVRGARPLYKEIKLVTSHVPWRDVPAVVEDWEAIGDGAIYSGLATQEFDIRWSSLAEAPKAYEAAIRYDLDVVSDYIARFESREALVLVLGDHQPVREATGSETWEVPVHAIGSARLLSRLARLGWRSGMRPAPEPLMGMDGVLQALRVSLSASPPRE